MKSHQLLSSFGDINLFNLWYFQTAGLTNAGDRNEEDNQDLVNKSADHAVVNDLDEDETKRKTKINSQ